MNLIDMGVHSRSYFQAPGAQLPWPNKVYIGALGVGVASSFGFCFPFMYTPAYFCHHTGKVPIKKMVRVNQCILIRIVSLRYTEVHATHDCSLFLRVQAISRGGFKGLWQSKKLHGRYYRTLHGTNVSLAYITWFIGLFRKSKKPWILWLTWWVLRGL